jgi:hypothetical protein
MRPAFRTKPGRWANGPGGNCPFSCTLDPITFGPRYASCCFTHFGRSPEDARKKGVTSCFNGAAS